MAKIHEEGYELVADGRSLNRIRRDYGHLLVGKKHTYNAPKDFAPGRNDDRTQGYHKGSKIVNEAGDVFMCIEEEAEQANWVKIASIKDASEGSFVNYEPEDEPEETTEPEPNTQPAPENEQLDPQEAGREPAVQDKAPEPKKQSSPADELFPGAAPSKSATALPEDTPFLGWLEKNDISTVEALEANIDELEDLKYFNEERAGKLREWFSQN